MGSRWVLRFVSVTRSSVMLSLSRVVRSPGSSPPPTSIEWSSATSSSTSVPSLPVTVRLPSRSMSLPVIAARSPSAVTVVTVVPASAPPRVLNDSRARASVPVMSMAAM